MQFIPIIFAVVVCILAVTLIIVAISLIRVLGQIFKFMKALNEVIDTSQFNLKEMIADVFTRLITKVELREELIEDLAMRSVAPTRKASKKKGEPKQMFKGL